MNHLVVNRRRLVTGIAVCALVAAILVTPTGRAVVLGSLVMSLKSDRRFSGYQAGS